MSGIEKLLPLLEEGTDAKKINWEPYGQHGVAVAIGHNTVVMDYENDEGGLNHYVQIRNKDGRVIEWLVCYHANDAPGYDRLERLHLKGQRVANRVDETISEVEGVLRRLLSR